MENGKILGLSKSVFWRIVGIVGGCCLFGLCVLSCRRSIDVDVDASRNSVKIQYVTPKKK